MKNSVNESHWQLNALCSLKCHFSVHVCLGIRVSPSANQPKYRSFVPSYNFRKSFSKLKSYTHKVNYLLHSGGPLYCLHYIFSSTNLFCDPTSSSVSRHYRKFNIPKGRDPSWSLTIFFIGWSQLCLHRIL